MHQTAVIREDHKPMVMTSPAISPLLFYRDIHPLQIVLPLAGTGKGKQDSQMVGIIHEGIEGQREVYSTLGNIWGQRLSKEVRNLLLNQTGIQSGQSLKVGWQGVPVRVFPLEKKKKNHQDYCSQQSRAHHYPPCPLVHYITLFIVL